MIQLLHLDPDDVKGREVKLGLSFDASRGCGNLRDSVLQPPEKDVFRTVERNEHLD